jgi:hypothetical protein
MVLPSGTSESWEKKRKKKSIQQSKVRDYNLNDLGQSL